LCDRYVLELVLAQAAGQPAPAGELELLERLAKVMNDIESREKKLERAAVDIAEAWTLRGREGERFAATVLGVRDGRAEVQIESPPVRVEAERGPGVGFLELGRRVVVRLTGVAVEEGRLEFVVETEAPA
jgi:exoribonuclease R